MVESLNIVVAHGDAGAVAEIVEAIGDDHSVVASFGLIEDLERRVHAERPDLIVVGTAFPDGDGIDAIVRLGAKRPIPAVIVTTRRSMDMVVKAMRDHVMAYLIEPVSRDDLLASIIVAWSRFDQLRELEEQVGDLKRALDERKIVERAKGILMASGGMTEQEAFARLRRSAQDRRVRMAAVADEIIAAIERTIASQQ